MDISKVVFYTNVSSPTDGVPFRVSVRHPHPVKEPCAYVFELETAKILGVFSIPRSVYYKELVNSFCRRIKLND